MKVSITAAVTCCILLRYVVSYLDKKRSGYSRTGAVWRFGLAAALILLLTAAVVFHGRVAFAFYAALVSSGVAIVISELLRRKRES